MTQAIRHFFASGNTARGNVHLTPQSFQHLQTLYLLHGYPGIGQQSIIARLADEMTKRDYSLELFHSPLHPGEHDALIVTNLQAGVADADRCQGLAELVGPRIVNVDLTEAVEYSPLSPETANHIADLRDELERTYNQAYLTFQTALHIHDDLERIFISRLNFDQVDRIADQFAREHLGSVKLAKQSVVRRFFFGAATPTGAQDYIMSLTEPLRTRVFIKGRPGSGKSTMLKKIAATAEERGIDVEIYHCGFDPGSVDMLIFPERSVAIFDSTAPHEHEPVREGDAILDMYERAIAPGTDQMFEADIVSVTEKYKVKMQEATAILAQAEQIDLKIRSFYADFVSPPMIDRYCHLLLSELLSHRE